MNTNSGLISACLLDGSGGARLLDWPDIDAWTPEQGVLWLHLDRTHPGSQQWLRDRSGLPEIVVEAMLEEETRPRTALIGNGLLAMMRGVNLNPGADITDMVAIRLWVDKHRIVSAVMRPLKSAEVLAATLQAGDGPVDAADFLTHLADHLVTRIAQTVDKLVDEVDVLEDHIDTQDTAQLRGPLGDIRRQIITLRRYLTPQRDMLTRLHVDRIEWISDRDRPLLNETADQMIRVVEELESTWFRVSIVQEEITSALSAQLNRRMYLVALMSVVFLPLSLLTGLLGANVGGIPGALHPWGFTLFSVLLTAIAAGIILILKGRRWM